MTNGKLSDKIRLFTVFAASGIISFAVTRTVMAKVEAQPASRAKTTGKTFAVQSIDTMKDSRDTARTNLDNPAFDTEIERQVALIAQTGATHIAVATPYDKEFLPFLKRWVEAARKKNLNVWFRGNLSGWENWFEYPAIDMETHTKLTVEFITGNPDLFRDGDLFTSCPECENGKNRDPRKNGKVNEYRKFLISEYGAVKRAFTSINRKVTANTYSMNMDVAKLIMDRKTTQSLDGMITVDHYVKTPEKYILDLDNLNKSSGARILVGEFGAPIPDIHGEMGNETQSRWIDKALGYLAERDYIAGVNYWTFKGGSSVLENGMGETNSAYGTITEYYSPVNLRGAIRDEDGKNITGAEVEFLGRKETANGGIYDIFVPAGKYVYFSSKNRIGVSTMAAGKPGTVQSRDIMLAKNPDAPRAIPAGIPGILLKLILYLR